MASPPAPLLSVIVPCHGAEGTIDAALKSVLQQDLDADFEVLAIDDGSTDATLSALQAWAAEDRRVRVLRNEACLGIGDTRNRGLAEARGDWIGFVDADDWVSRRYFGSLVRAMVEHELDFVRCDLTRVSGLRRWVAPAPEPRREVTLRPSSSILPVHAPSMVDYPYSMAGLYRRSFLESKGLTFQSGLPSAEDRLFTWRLHVEGSAYRCLAECGYFYQRGGEHSLTRAGDRRQLAFFDAIDAVSAYLEQSGAPEPFREKARRQALDLLVSHYDRRARLLPETRWEFYQRARELLARLADQLSPEVLQLLGPGRRAVLDRLAEGSGDHRAARGGER